MGLALGRVGVRVRVIAPFFRSRLRGVAGEGGICCDRSVVR